MANFFVGLRVKKVRGTINIGMEGVVVETAPFAFPGHEPNEIRVKFNADWVNEDGVKMPASTPAYARSKYYEPILPEGAQSSSWSRCLWQPEHLRAAA